ncbi:MAG: AAA family ATPase [Verrucomicrobiae bacterium]|nr:AAA family ATPase [Verrucomicrobiae bacterium]
MLRSLQIRGYRSLREFRMKFGNITIVTGANGVGKSNVYRSLALVQRMAEGNFAASLAAEGGMPSALWAGERRRDEPKRISWDIEHDDFEFAIECGLIPLGPGSASMFRTDPEIKSESLRFAGKPMARRKGPVIEARGPDGVMEASSLPFHDPESMLCELRDGTRHPAVVAARETILGWRFYHHFRTDADSPIRRPQLGSWSPVLAHDGSNLAATLQTIVESGGGDVLHAAIESAFDEIRWSPADDTDAFHLQVTPPGLTRPMAAAELSDGTLRFFCLAAALLTPKPPPLLVLNEPEASLHSGLIQPLADLIGHASKTTQLLVVTHSHDLAAAIRTTGEAVSVELVSHEGETRPKGLEGARRAWSFD